MLRDKMMEMLYDLPGPTKYKFKYDTEAAYSFTNLKIGYDLALFLTRLPGISTVSTITDSMASVGGNTIAFAKYFKHVNAIELNPKRKEMLDSNIKLIGLKNVDTYQGYAQDYIYNLKQDVIFFDPPWGGLDYRKEESMDINIDGPNGQESFNDVAKSTFGHCKYCVIKLPNNYNIEKLKKMMTKFKLVHIEWHGKPNSMVIMIFKAAA